MFRLVFVVLGSITLTFRSDGLRGESCLPQLLQRRYLASASVSKYYLFTNSKNPSKLQEVDLDSLRTASLQVQKAPEAPQRLDSDRALLQDVASSPVF